MTRILLAEDHDLVRLGFKSIIEGQEDLTIEAEAEDGEACLALVEKMNPDILIIDLSMPKLSGMAVISKLKKMGSPVKTIVLTAAEAPNVWNEVLGLGVDGIALKSVSQSELVAGICSVRDGGQFIHTEIEPAIENGDEDVSTEANGRKAKKLSVREKQVIKLVAEGYKTKEVAEMLGISDRTVSKHRENIMTKLEMTASAELVNYANHIGLLKVQLDEIQ